MTPTPDYIEHFIPVSSGLRLYCREYGRVSLDKAPAVLCLPGLTRNCRDFENLARSLAAAHRVFTPDLRGRGRSDYDPTWQNYQPMTYVHDVGELLQALRIPRVILIGTSLGGLIAMTMAFLQPSRLAGVLLNDVGPELSADGLARIAKYAGQLPPVSSWDEAAAQAKQFNGIALPDYTDEDWRRFARNTYRENGSGIPVPDMDPRIGDVLRQPAGPTPDLWPLFRALMNIPTAVLRGELSDILLQDTVDRMKSEKPDLQVTIVANRGHAPTLDEADAREAISRLIKSAV
jgi:pimeloyl-ACP methyl ester carboxylesterase